MQSENDRLERWLDSALRQYGAAEPRAGLEERVLARMRVEQESERHSWSWGLTLGLATAVAIMAGILAVEQVREVPPPTARVAGTPPITRTPVGEMTFLRHGTQARNSEAGGGSRRSVETAESSLPRKDQFPSPAPLSEQEQMLARYVREHHQQAILEARALTEMKRLDALEENQFVNDNGAISRNPKEDNRD